MSYQERGYTLTELLVTFVIIAVLGGGGLYLYRSHLISTRRADALLSLVKLQSVLENYYLIHKTYQGATPQTLHISDTSPQGYYRLEVELHEKGQSYDALAIPQGDQAKDDEDCGTLVLSTDGRRSYRGKDPEASCW